MAASAVLPGSHECCAGDLELYANKAGVLGALASPWKRHFFQLLVAVDGSVLLTQWGSAREQQEPWTRPSTLPPVPTYHLHQVEDIVQPARTPRAWFELWFANGAVVRLRTFGASSAEHWSTWVTQLLLHCPRVRQRMVATLDSDPEQATVHGVSPAQLRAEELVSLRAEAMRNPDIAAVVGEHQDFKHGASDAATAAALAAAESAAGSAAAASAATATHAAAAQHLTLLKDTLLSETRHASTMVEDRLALVETGLQAASASSTKTLAALAGSLDAVAANVQTLAGEVAALSTREAAAGAAALARLDALGASVMEASLRTRGDVSAVRSNLDHVEKLVLGLAPRVVASGSGSNAGAGGGAAPPANATAPLGLGATARSSTARGAGGGFSPAPVALPPPPPEVAGPGGAPLATEASLAALLSALMNHTRAMDLGLGRLAEQQAATDAAVGAVRASMEDISRGMTELARRQEALWVKMGSSSVGGGGVAGGSGGVAGVVSPRRSRPGGAAAYAEGEAASSSSAARVAEEVAAQLAAQARPGAASAHAPAGQGIAALQAAQREVLAELSRVVDVDLTDASTVMGAVRRIPTKARSTPAVSALLGRLRDLDAALEEASGRH